MKWYGVVFYFGLPSFSIMLSRCIHVVMNQWFAFLIVEWYLWMDIPQFGYLLLSWWTLELFPVGFFTNIKLLWTYEHKSLSVHMFLFLLGEYVTMGLLDGMVHIDSTLEETAQLYSTVIITISVPLAGYKSSGLPHFHQLGIVTL